MNKRAAVAAMVVVAALAFAGCDLVTTTERSATSGDMQVSLLLVDQGWVEVELSGPVGGYRVHWGDSYLEESYTDVSGPGTYTHWYPREGRYAAALLSGETELVIVSVPVPVVSHHLEVIAHSGRQVTVRFWGDEDVAYEINWGTLDYSITPGPQRNYHNGMTVHANGSPTGDVCSYEYYQAGTFDISMRTIGEIPSDARVFATVVAAQ